ncbi:bacteriorhodopsin [Haloarcula nitratireducens]|uniref:Bacteriorhodopsin n=1 Tax=Haloarcula nitratireducens TaxID=2487749 RepID=A0AAW4PDQ7_9EURY|nr:bacteriorhodopsin [Halomicroarcula nitratireducens]MBX0295723.1 bacteriorhodopsin [Halomicroarcula nitratireducens]
MISQSGVYGVAAAVSAAAFLVFLGWLSRVPASRRRYCYPVVAVVGFSAAMSALTSMGVAPVAGTRLSVPSMIDDLVAYSVLWTVAVALADESRRMLAVAAVVPAVQVVAFNVASVVGGVVGLACLAVVVLGHGLMAYLLFGPIWRRAADVPDGQRLLHWKSRNLLLFLVGMLIVYALLSVAAVFDSFVIAVLRVYIGLLIRVGFAGFLFVNVTAIAVGGVGSTDSGPASFADEAGVSGSD